MMIGYCDADYAIRKYNRKSITGYVLTLRGGEISSSKNQVRAALSTTGAAYFVSSAAVQEAL